MSLKKLGRYDLIRVLGKGAMGLVYEGRDPNLDRRVAIKTIKVENLSEEAAADYETRFRTEARSAARLQHPHIVSVYDSDRDSDIAYLVMEFIPGEDLKHHLDQGKRHTLDETLAIMADLLSALEYAHGQSIVHRDIKPANMLIAPNGRIKLTDFGVARIQDSGEATRTQGTIVGTLKYMAPEQVQGLPVDPRADLFAAGIVLYQLLTGRRPFDGDSDFAIIQQIVNHTPVAVTIYNSGLPPALDRVISKVLAKQRDLRYATAADFGAALQAAAREATDRTVVPPPGAPRPGASATWSATVKAGEGLVGLNSASGTGATGTGGGTFSGNSTVTQELELVYWKEIQDSADAEDFSGFLSRFPAGIYADLARRRLRKLGQGMGEDTDRGSRAGTLAGAATVVLPRSETSHEATLVLDRPGESTATGVGAAALAASLAAGSGAGRGESPTAVIAGSRTDIDGGLQGHPGDGQRGTAQGISSDTQREVGAALAASAATGKAVPMPTFSGSSGAGPSPSAILAGNSPAEPVMAPQRVSSPSASQDGIASVATPPHASAGASGAVSSSTPLPASPTPAAPDASSATAQAATGKPPSRAGLWAVAAAVLVVVGGAMAWMSGSSGNSVDAPLAAASAPGAAMVAASAPVVPGATSAASAPVVVANAVDAAPSAATSNDTAVSAKAPAAAASAPQAAASAAAARAAARKLAQEARAARQAQAKASPGAGDSTPTPVAAAAPATDTAAKRTESASPAGSPRAACENRILLGFQICMAEQCAKPGFAQHPICVERRAMEQRRNEAQANR